jgi:cold shock CspA family protein
MDKIKKVSIGIVKWFGGYNNSTGKENNYGFIESLLGEDLYIHKNNLNDCNSLLEKELVSFRIKKKSTKLEAIDVKKITINEISSSNNITKEEFIKLLELFPNEKETFKSFDLFLDDEDIQKKLYGSTLRYKYRDFLNLFNQLQEYKTVNIEFDSNEVYNQLVQEDWELAKKWANKKDDNFELARMISARSAEKVAKRYYESLGFLVEDIALTQVISKIDDWKVCDLKVNDEISVDVKNARFPNNSNFYSNHCIPKFKEDRNGEEVKIFGVVSPYIQVEDNEVSSIYNKEDRDIRVLGETSLSKIKELEEEFNSNFFSISDTKNFIPEWMFEYPIEFYSERKKILTKFKNTSIVYPNNIEYQKLNIRIIPLYIILGLDIQNDILLDDWEGEFVKGLTSYAKENEFISMPFLYLYILKHFLEMIKKKEIIFHPNKYKKLIYFNQEDNTRPLGIYDKNKYIDMFITSLSQIFDSQVKEKVQRFTSFKFHKKGLLQGKESLENKYTTIFAYCGGNIKGKGYCGYMPLIIGKEKTCNHCKKLICPKCDFCLKGCIRRERIDKVVKFLQEEKGRLEKEDFYDVYEYIYNKEYIPPSGKSWSLKSLDKKYIVDKVLPQMEKNIFRTNPKRSHLQRKLP